VHVEYWGHLWMAGIFFTKLCCCDSCRYTWPYSAKSENTILNICDAMQISGVTYGWMAAFSPNWASQCLGRRT
jgi:hypothetical protein